MSWNIHIHLVLSGICRCSANRFCIENIRFVNFNATYYVAFLLFILLRAPGGQRSPASTSIHDFFIRSSIEAANASTTTSQGATEASAPNSYFCHLPSLAIMTEANRRTAAHRIFRMLMENKKLKGLMPKLLSSLSDDGWTPFMLAIQCKAYQAAAYILDFLIVSHPPLSIYIFFIIQKVSAQQMIFMDRLLD